MARKKVLAIPKNDIFLKRDVELLKNHFEIRTALGFNHKKPLTIIPCVFGILRGTLWADLTFSWFADVSAFFAVLFSKILGKRSIVVVGGYEVAKVPDIEYGSMLHPVLFRIVRWVLKHADSVLTVDDSLKEDAIRNAGVSGGNIKTVPTCYDSEAWKPCREKKNTVITVALVKSESVIKRKGLKTFIEAARYLPDVRFVLIGPILERSAKWLKAASPSNVEFPGFVSPDKLPEWCSEAKVYCQLSRYEGLPNALCEAMLCDCVPVGTEHCGIPVAIGDTGFYVPYGDAEATAEAIKKALEAYDHGKGNEARERIKSMFPRERRGKELVSEVEELLK